MTDPIGVFVVDDHTILRSGLKLLIGAQNDLTVAGEASSGEEALTALRTASDVRVVLMDLMMEGMGGIEATRAVRSEHPGVAVLVLTMADDRAYLRDAFAAGASGYVLKDAADVELVQAIRTVAEGGRYLHPALGAELVASADDTRTGPAGRFGVPLSAREVDVLRLVARGYANKEIADELFISIRTVETHKTHIQQKTGLKKRAELVRFAKDARIDV